jgi:hypothetical protein
MSLALQTDSTALQVRGISTRGLIDLTRDAVRGISHLGGTIIGSTNKGNPIAYPVQQDDGTWTEVDRSDD